jgi:hypothetical protein
VTFPPGVIIFGLAESEGPAISIIEMPEASSSSFSIEGVMGTLVQPEMKVMRRSPRMVIKNTLLCFTIYSSFRTFSEKEVLRVTHPFEFETQRRLGNPTAIAYLTQ